MSPNSSKFMVSLLILLLSIGVVTGTQLARLSVRAAEKEEALGPVDYVALTEDQEVESFFDAAPDQEAAAVYHKRINTIFNRHITQLVSASEFLEDEQKPEDAAALVDSFVTKLAPPPLIRNEQTGAPEKRSACVEENLSTYCLSIEVVKEYIAYRSAMLTLRAQEKERAVQQRGLQFDENNNVDAQGAQRALLTYGETIIRIDNELGIAEKALDHGLAAYNELQMALPMHLKFKKVISALEDYRDELASVRRSVELYPVSFLDVTTPACT